MGKLTPKYDRRTDGSKNIKGYIVSLQKIATEKIAGFDENTELKIEYEKDRIILKRKK